MKTLMIYSWRAKGALGFKVDDLTWAWASELKWVIGRDNPYPHYITKNGPRSLPHEIYRRSTCRRRKMDERERFGFKNGDELNFSFSNLEIVERETLLVWDGERNERVPYRVDDDIWWWADEKYFFIKNDAPVTSIKGSDGTRATVRLVREIFRRKRRNQKLDPSLEVQYRDGDHTNLHFSNLRLVKKGTRLKPEQKEPILKAGRAGRKRTVK